MNIHKVFCICLQEVMLENNKYNFEREYEFYATTPPPGSEKQEKDITHKTLNIRKTIQLVAL